MFSFVFRGRTVSNLLRENGQYEVPIVDRKLRVCIKATNTEKKGYKLRKINLV